MILKIRVSLVAGLLVLAGCGKKAEVATPAAKGDAPAPLPPMATQAAVAAPANPVPAGEPAIIARARARLGSDAALDGLQSVHYFGTLTTSDAKDPAKQIQAKVEMIFQKPDHQRITATYDKFVETTALDSYEAWTRLQNSSDPTQWQLTLLDGEQVKRLRANTWQALDYFRGIEHVGGHLEDKGTVTVDGVTCEKIAFVHDPKIVFTHYFDVATGALVLTETEGGATLRQSGEMVVNSIRFPKTFTTTTKSGDRTATVTVTYDRIVLNEALPPETFRVPQVPRK